MCFAQGNVGCTESYHDESCLAGDDNLLSAHGYSGLPQKLQYLSIRTRIHISLGSVPDPHYAGNCRPRPEVLAANGLMTKRPTLRIQVAEMTAEGLI